MARAEPPVIPRADGAPGENQQPEFALEPVGPGEQVFLQAPPGLQPPGDTPIPDTDETGPKLDDLDKRAPVRKARQDVWEKAAVAADADQWDEVLKFLGQWHDRAKDDGQEDSLVRKRDGSLRSGRLESARLLVRLPQEQRHEREEQVGGRARSRLNDAVQSGELNSLSRVASRYFGTSAGYAAASRLATRLLDRGDFALAARWLLLLHEASAPGTDDPAFRKRIRLVLSITGLEGGSEDAPADTAADETVDALAASLITAQPELVNEWRLSGGNAARHARAPGGEPVLIPRWVVSTVSSSRLRDSIDEMIESLTERRAASVPAAAPICVAGRVISRTVRGIEVVDAATGQRLWATDERGSVERLLESSSPRQSRRVTAGDWAIPQLLGESGGVAVGESAGPLSQFLYQNAAHGLISSDGRYVFYVEDDAILTLGRTSMRNGVGIDETPEPGSESANRLTACDVQTGRIAWQVGGPESTDLLSSPLTGLFFMGAPLPVGDDLFVVAMKGRDVRLYCLDSGTGSARWSQLLAFADHQPDRDLVRRIWSAQPSVAHGVVVCPTHVGWLVAVDRSTGTLLWTHRYAKKKRSLLTPSFDPFADSGLPSTASEPMNSRWATSAPIIAGRHVFVTPAESRTQDDPSSSVIACLDLFSGERLWQKARGNGRYLAGVSDNRAIVVENDAVVAYGLKGKREWDTDLPREVGVPSGRGVITDNSLWLPTQKSRLLRIDLTNGKIADRLTLPENGRPLGNLAMYRGMLISHHPSELQAFEQTTVLEQRLSAARSLGRHDPATALLDARLALARGKFDRAMIVLKEGLATSPDPQIRTQLRSLLAQAILKNLESAPAASLSLVRELEELAGSADESLRNEQLAIEVLLRTGHPDEALALLIERDTFETRPLVKMLGHPSVTSSLFAWMEERLTLAWSQLSSTQRRVAGTAISTRLNETGASELIRERRARLYAFHPSAALLQARLAEEAIEQKQFARASHWLKRMTESNDPEVATRAMAQQIELNLQNFIDQSELQNNITRAERLATRLSLETPFTTRLTELRQVFETRAAEYRASEEDQWPLSQQLRVVVTRSGGSYSRPTTFGVDPVDGDSPAGSRYRIQVSGDGKARRLSLIERRNGDLAWSVVIRGNSGGGRNLSVRRAGPMLLVLHRGVLNCLSIPDRRVLWTRSVDVPDSPLKFPKVKAVKLQPGTDWINRLTASANDPLPIVNSSYVCSRGRKSLSVFDTLSGELLWQLDPAPRTVRVHATSSMICLVRRNGQVAASYDALSGRRLKDAPEQLHSPLAQIGDQTVTANMDEAGEVITVESRNPEADTPVWSHEFEAEHAFGMVGRNRLAVMRNRGMFAVLDLQTGALQSFDRIPASLRIGKSDFSVLRDESRWYVILNGDVERDYQAPSLRSALISGHLLAFDATTGKQLWRQSLSNQYLILDQLSSSPFLLTLRPSSNPLGIPSESLRLMLFRKSDGSPLLDQSLPGSISIHSMRLDPQSRFVELLASGDRIMLNVEPVEEP